MFDYGTWALTDPGGRRPAARLGRWADPV